MALPYPGMDFTPLDILTADEMDHIVANIEYLAQDGWQAYTVTAPSGYTIVENQSRINRKLGLFCLSLRLTTPSGGTGTTAASGLPNPSGGVSFPVVTRVETGNMQNQCVAGWIRASGGTLGLGANYTNANVSALQIGGTYPIAVS